MLVLLVDYLCFRMISWFGTYVLILVLSYLLRIHFVVLYFWLFLLFMGCLVLCRVLLLVLAVYDLRCWVWIFGWFGALSLVVMVFI